MEATEIAEQSPLKAGDRVRVKAATIYVGKSDGPLTPQDTSKTSWAQRWRTPGIALTASEMVLAEVSDSIESALMHGMNTAGFLGGVKDGPLKEGDPLWTQAYQHALQLRIHFDALRKLASELLPVGQKLRVMQCGKIVEVTPENRLDIGCAEGPCALCAPTRRYGIMQIDIEGKREK